MMTHHTNVADVKYPDVGCDIVTELLGHESRCLECPLPQCVEDRDDHRDRYAKVWSRHESMRNAYYVKGWTVARIAIEFNVGHRTVQRALVEDREEVGCPTS